MSAKARSRLLPSSWIVRAVQDGLIRRRSAMDRVPVDRFTVRVARTEQEYEEAFRLLHVAYVYEGIEAIKSLDMRMNEQHVLPEATVLVAYEGERLVGTITLTVDSPAGLPLDREYSATLDSLRRRGARLGEIGCLAVVRRCQKTGLLLLLGQAAVRLGFGLLGTTHHVMGIHPRAQDLYRAIWTFEALGEPCQHADLDAPMLGMVHERRRVLTHFQNHYSGKLRGSAYSPYDYLFGESPLPGFDLPQKVEPSDWPRWKMPRAVFQRLFIDHSDRLETLSSRTTAYLRRQRSDQTLALKSLEATPSQTDRSGHGQIPRLDIS